MPSSRSTSTTDRHSTSLKAESGSKVTDAAPQHLFGQKESFKSEDLELLVSHSSGQQSGKTSLRPKVVLHLVLLALGLFGTAICLWAMLYTSHSEEVAMNMGLNRIANSLENILSLLAYPVIMFTVILSAYATQQLFLIYRAATRPEKNKRARKRS